uniref:Uncharacterized protein n=1 Tax=Chenopodium quinoa TaxID=63459 RepID=A0A803L414_CHEQI
MEVERRIYDKDRFDDFLKKYFDDYDDYSETGRKFSYRKELKILKKLFLKIKICTKNRELHAMNYIDIMKKLKNVVIDVSDACFIQAFDEPENKFGLRREGAMGSVDPANEAELALEVIDYYNKHKGAKLKFVCMKRANVLFCYLIHYYITFTAVDEDTGCIGTYQAALLKRHLVSIIGLFRDANAHKTLSLLSINGRTLWSIPPSDPT